MRFGTGKCSEPTCFCGPLAPVRDIRCDDQKAHVPLAVSGQGILTLNLITESIDQYGTWASNGSHRTSLFVPNNHLYDVGQEGSSAGPQRLIRFPVHVTVYSERLVVGLQIPRKKSRLGTLAVHHWGPTARSSASSSECLPVFIRNFTNAPLILLSCFRKGESGVRD